MRKCPFDNCGKSIDENVFACAGHWRTLGPSEKVAIYDCFEKWRRGEITGDELRSSQQAVLGDRGQA